MAVTVNELEVLPPLSVSAQEILKIINRDDAELSEFIRIVEHCPALLAKIIALANSAFYGVRSVTDVRRAIIDVLGFPTARNIALGVVLSGVFIPGNCRAFDLPKYWLLSLLTAALAKNLVLEMKLTIVDANDAYVTGMLNEIGLLALAYLHPQEMTRVLENGGDEQSILAREMEIFGNSHYIIGIHLMREWNLPAIIQQVMLESAPDSHQQTGDLCQIIHFCQLIAYKIYEQTPIELDAMKLPAIMAHQLSTLDSVFSHTQTKIGAYQEMANLLS